MRADGSEDLAETERAEVRDEDEHREQKPNVSDAVDDEGFSAGTGGGVFRVVEADKQIGREADAFPAHEHEQEVLCEHERENEEEEEVHVGKESPVTLFFSHVAHGVDVNQEADAGDDAKHHERELIDGEGKV